MLPVLPHEATDRINQLREEKKKAITDSRYERARELDAEIKAVKDGALDEAIVTIKQQFCTSVSDYLDRFQEQRDSPPEELAQAKQNVCIKYHRAFEELQEAQKQKLLECEQDWRRDDRLEHLRPIPKHEEQMELSRKSAATSDYERAIELRDGARQIAEEDLKKRVAACEQGFIQRRENLMEQFRRELSQLNARFKGELSDVEAKADERKAANASRANAQIAAMLQRGQARLARLGVADPARVLEPHLQKILDERKWPTPAVATLYKSIQSKTANTRSPKGTPTTTPTGTPTTTPTKVRAPLGDSGSRA
jgi:hypothetical protein